MPGAALVCACGCGFCACCLADCGTDAHEHVKGCSKQPNKGSYYLPTEQWYAADTQPSAQHMPLAAS